MIKRIGTISLWLVGLIFVFVGINCNDPYLIALRGTPSMLLLLLGASVAVFLFMRSYRRGWRVSSTLLILVWCVAPLSMLSARAVFEWRKSDVLRTEP